MLSAFNFSQGRKVISLLRRANGEGSIYYEASRKSYVYEFNYQDPITGETKRKRCSSRKSAREARKRAASFLEKLQKEAETALKKQEEAKKSPPVTVEEWLTRWVDKIQKPQVKIKTYERYRSHIFNNIVPFLGAYQLKDLTLPILQEALYNMSEFGGASKQGIAPRSVNASRNILRAALRDAVNYKLIEMNPATDTKALRVEPPIQHILSKGEAKKLMRVALRQSKHSWIAIVIALTTGMRLGEIFGLTWACVDLEEKKLKVKQSVVTTTKGKIFQPSVKRNSSIRTIPLPDKAVHALKRYKQWQEVSSRKFGYKYAEAEWVLANPEGDFRSPNSFSSHDYKDALEAAGISKDVRFHDLRHTHATWLLEDKVNVKVVSERLGHSSIRITLDTYAEVLETMQETAVEALNNIF